MTLAVRGALWSVVYLLVVTGPLLLMIVGDAPPARGFWKEFSVGLGFVGLSMLGLQFATTARFHPVAAPYGKDLIIAYHRQMSYVAFGFLLVHPLILVVITPLGSTLYTWDFDAVEADGVTGMLALSLVVLIIATSALRERFRLRYEPWRRLHGLLGLGILGTSLWHIFASGYYVDGPLRQGLWIAMTVAFMAMYAHVRLIRPWQQRRRPWVLERVEPLAGDTWELHLRADGHHGMAFQPGQFAWLTLDRSPFGIREHPFSFCSSAEETDHVRFAVKELGDFTSRLDEFPPGTRAYLDGPFGAFTYERNEAPGFVFIAGGIGVTPVLSMLETLADRGDARPMLLLYANPEEGEITFRDRLDELTSRLDLEVVHVLTDAADDWEGERGYVDDALLDRYLPDDEGRQEYFICGPDPLMDAAESALHERGISGERLNLERFAFV